MNKVTGEKIAGFFFSFMLVLTLLVLTFSFVSKEENLFPFLEEVLQNQNVVPESFDEASFPEVKTQILSDCAEYGTGKVTVAVNSGTKEIELDCNKVRMIQTPNELFIQLSLEDFRKEYKQKHDCSFLMCFVQAGNYESRVSLLVSEKGNDFYANIYWFVIGFTAIVGLVFAYFSGGFFGLSRNFGWAYAVLGVGFVFAEVFKLFNVKPVTGIDISSPIMETIFLTTQKYFAVYFIVGVFLLIVGYGGNWLFLKIKGSQQISYSRSKIKIKK